MMHVCSFISGKSDLWWAILLEFIKLRHQVYCKGFYQTINWHRCYSFYLHSEEQVSLSVANEVRKRLTAELPWSVGKFVKLIVSLLDEEASLICHKWLEMMGRELRNCSNSYCSLYKAVMEDWGHHSFPWWHYKSCWENANQQSNSRALSIPNNKKKWQVYNLSSVWCPSGV